MDRTGTDSQPFEDDAELARRSESDPRAFGVIVSRYEERLFRYVHRIAAVTDEDAEDILQEAFIKAYQNLNGYDRSLRFSSWLYRIVHNQTVDFLRRNRLRPRAGSIDAAEWAKFVAAPEDTAREISDRECLEAVRQAVERLPFRYREAVALRFLEEKDYGEIMDILRKPKGTVATLIARGRKFLLADLGSRGMRCRGLGSDS